VVGFLSAVWRYSAHRFADIPLARFEWCVLFIYLHARARAEADSSLCDLTDAWNQVRFSFSWFLLFRS
jgi:hypothetical protein